MYSIKTELKNVSGLHARPASEFVAMAKQFESKVTIQRLSVVRVDKERNLLLIKGAVPGPQGGLVLVKNTVKPRK